MSPNKKVTKEVGLRGLLALPRETPFPLKIPQAHRFRFSKCLRFFDGRRIAAPTGSIGGVGKIRGLGFFWDHKWDSV